MALSSPKPNDTTDYTGVSAPNPTDGGTLQTAGWANDLTSPPWWDFPNEVLQGVPANVRVQLSGTGVMRLAPTQYSVTLSLSGMNRVQLIPNAANARQNPTAAISPNVFVWRYTSRNVNVATVDSNGLVTAVGRGECEILVTSPRNVNAPEGSTFPLANDGVQASVQVRVLE